MKNESLLKPKDWKLIDSQLCLVKSMATLGGAVKDGKVVELKKNIPFASIVFENEKLGDNITGYVDSAIDFLSLSQALEYCKGHKEAEVVMSWSVTHNKNWIVKKAPIFFPKIVAMVVSKGVYQGSQNWYWAAGSDGLAQIYSLVPIKLWLPVTMVGADIATNNQCKTEG